MIKPFKLDGIKKVSRHEIDLVRAMYEVLPPTEARERLHVAIRKSLMKHLGQDVRYYLSSTTRQKFNEFSAGLPEHPVLIVFGFAPVESKLIVQIDYNVANLVINKLLGSGEGDVPDARPLTETEQGVLQYLIMQVLKEIYGLAGASPRAHFRLEKFIFDPASAGKYAEGRGDAYLMHINVSVADQSGFLRLIFPDSFLEEAALLAPAGIASGGEERKYFSKHLGKWAHVKTSVWAEAGSSLLSPAEIKDLGEGDVILFDDSGIKISGKKVEGDVTMHFGSAEREVTASLLEAAPKKIGCKLERIKK